MKKFFAILLSIFLVLSLVPTFAFASGVDEQVEPGIPEPEITEPENAPEEEEPAEEPDPEKAPEEEIEEPTEEQPEEQPEAPVEEEEVIDLPPVTEESPKLDASFTDYGGTMSTPYGTFTYHAPVLGEKRDVTFNIYVNGVLTASYYPGDVYGGSFNAKFTTVSPYHVAGASVNNGYWGDILSGDITTWSHPLSLDATKKDWTINLYLTSPHTVTVNYVYPDNSESNSDIQTLGSYTKSVFHGEEFKSNEWNYYDAADARNSYTATVKNETANKSVDVSGTAWGGYYFKDTVNADTTYTVTLNPTNKSDEPLAVDAYLYRGGNAVGFDRYMNVTFNYSGYNISSENGNDQVYVLKDGKLVQPNASNNNIGNPAIIVQDNTQYKFYMSGLGLNLAQVKDLYYDSSDQNWYYIYRWVTDLELIDVSWTNTVGPIVIPPSESGRINFVYKEYESEHKLIYDANGGTGAPATQTKTTSDYVWNFTVSSGVPTRDGYTFLGWADTADATEPTYHGGSTIGVTGSKTIYAVWKQKSVIDEHVTLTPADVIKTYDGTTYTAGTATAVDDAGNPVVIEYSTDGTTWVTDPSTITATNVADSKVISVRASVPGVYEGYVTATQQLTIQPREVTVTGDGWTGDQPYTGNEYSKTTYTFDNVVSGQTATITYSIKGKEIGPYTGVFGDDFKVMDGQNEVTANYTLTTKTPGTLNITAPETKDLSYTIKYVVDSTSGTVLKSTDKTVEIPSTTDTYSVTSVPSEEFTGYKVKTNPSLPATVSDKGVIYVIYEKDLSQTKDLLYYVNYVVDSKTGTVLEGPVEKAVSIWINDTTYKVAESDVESKTFTGYKKDSFDPALPADVENGGSIYVIYVKDDSQTKELTYTVQYVTDDETVLGSEDKTVDVWVNDTTYEVTSVDSKTFPGYKVKTEPTLPVDVEDGDVITVIYEKDPTQTKKLTYTVNYVVDDETGDVLYSDEVSVDVWVNDTTYEVTAVEAMSFVGYVLKTNPTLPVVVEEGDEIFVIYEAHFGSLTITKKVAGELADKNKKFSFKLQIDADGRFPYTTNFGESGYISNGGTVQLKHGESVTISELPAGAKYSVTESGNSGYRVYASNDVGVIKLDETVKVTFTNSKGKVPATGDDRNTGLWLCIMGASFLGMAAAVLPDGRKRKPGHLKNR